jgi:glutamyl-tRNA synthetase
MADGAAFYFVDTITYDEKAQAKFLTADQQPLFAALLTGLEKCDQFDQEQLEAAFAGIMEQTALKFGKVAQPLRVALTGGTASPSIYEVLQVLGKEKSLQRIRQAAGAL